MTRPRKPQRFSDLVRRGVIDRRRLPHRLPKAVADDLRRRADELLHRHREDDAQQLPL